MDPRISSRRSLWVAACLFLLAGCGVVHQRQALYPNANKGLLGIRETKPRANALRAPLVDLRIEPELDPRSTGAGVKN